MKYLLFLFVAVTLGCQYLPSQKRRSHAEAQKYCAKWHGELAGFSPDMTTDANLRTFLKTLGPNSYWVAGPKDLNKKCNSVNQSFFR